MINGFDHPADRNGSHALKWDGREKVFGREDVLPLWIADMDYPAPECVQEAVAEKAKHGIFGYSLTPESYYQAMINWLQSRQGWTIKKDWILHSPGIVPALNYAVQAFSSPGDKILIQSPVYPPFLSAITNNHRVVLNNPLDLSTGRYRMDWNDLEEKLAQKPALMILCSPHNPVGRVWEVEELKRLGKLCLDYNVPVVADEIHGDLVYWPHKHTPLASLDEGFAYNIITLTSASKTFNLAGFQSASPIISNPELRRKFEQILHQNGIFFKSLMGVAADEAAYLKGGPWVDALLDYLNSNVKYLQDYLQDHISGIKVVPPQGTYLVWLDCRGLNMNDEELNRFFIHKVGLGLNQGISFGEGGEGFMRMNIACSRKLLEKAMNRLAKALI